MWQFIFFIVSTILTYVLREKPKNAVPGRIDLPSVEEGRKIGVLFGSRWIKSPHLFWWGDVRTTPVKAKGGK